jgi:mannose-6-phosphate isomerase
MADVYKLHNQVKHYEWGSADFIPRLTGIESDGSPCAELWMGSRPGSSSRINLPDGEIGLDECIARDACRYLGPHIAERYGTLPFLFKVLAVEKPLSIQAHPNPDQARAGFDRENRAGLAPDAPNRNYRDSNHKPEILCALSYGAGLSYGTGLPCEQGTPFIGMCGFRDPSAIRRLLGDFGSALAAEGLAPLLQALEMPDPAGALRHFLQALFDLSPPVRRTLTEYILASPHAGHDTHDEWELMRQFARLYPEDPAILAPLYLNVFRLEPGEAIFLKAGVLHAYVHGCGVELMADSDNVLRGGLTAKHIDVPELLRILDFTPFKPQIIRPESGSSCFTYPTPCDAFSLAFMRGPQAVMSRNAPAIGIVTEGEVSAGGTVLKRGESVFIPPHESPLVLQGDFTLYAASVPPR